MEVKCFPDGSADTSELYTALGQYLIYRGILEQQQINLDLYLAVPVEAYEDVFSRMALKSIEMNRVKIVVVDMEREVIVQWLT